MRHEPELVWMSRMSRVARTGRTSRGRQGPRGSSLLTEPLPSLEDRLPVAVIAAVSALFAVQALLAFS
jgi:hypothetical protein